MPPAREIASGKKKQGDRTVKRTEGRDLATRSLAMLRGLKAQGKISGLELNEYVYTLLKSPYPMKTIPLNAEDLKWKSQEGPCRVQK